MPGIILSVLSSLCVAVSDAFGKDQVSARKQSLYAMAFFSYAFGFLWFLGIAIYHRSFYFNPAALPTFIIRLALETVLTYVSLKAITVSSMSTFGFFRTGTMVLLLLVDIVLGYTLTLQQIGGVVLIVVALLVLYLNHGVERKGVGWVMMATILPVPAVSLYKYDITHFNSVEMEQLATVGFLLVVFYLLSVFREKESPFKMLARAVPLAQSFGGGLGSMLGSFAYLFAPASIIMTATRSSSVLWSIIAGNVYFKEKHFLIKIFSAALLMLGIFLMV